MVIAWCCAIFAFGEDTAGMLRASIATMERHSPGERYYCVIDEAGAHGEAAGERLGQPLTQEAGEEVAADLADLEAIVGEVLQSVASLRLLNRMWAGRRPLRSARRRPTCPGLARPICVGCHPRTGPRRSTTISWQWRRGNASRLWPNIWSSYSGRRGPASRTSGLQRILCGWQGRLLFNG